MRPARIILATVSIPLTFMAGTPVEAQLRGGGGSGVGRGRGDLYSANWQSHSRLTSVDTLRLRYLLLNGGDGPLTVHVRPCGIRVVADVEVVTEAAPMCDLVPVTLQPGDSVWADWAGRIEAEPGRYTLTAHYAGAPDETGALVTGHSVDVTVVPLETGGRTVQSVAPSASLEPYLLRLGGIVDNPAARRDFEQIFFTIGTATGRYFVPFAPEAAAARARVRPILVVDLTVEEQESRRRASDWGIRIGRYTTVVGWLSIAPDGAETITCNHGGSAGGGGLPAFGAMLAGDIRTVVERGDRCGR